MFLLFQFLGSLMRLFMLLFLSITFFFFFFFQAEDGIRDWSVTGVQTCALPIFISGPVSTPPWFPSVLDQPQVFRPATTSPIPAARAHKEAHRGADPLLWHRSEERRVGKECRSRWSPKH